MSVNETRRVIVDTDTAGDDALALLLAATSSRIQLEGVTICAGNVEFNYQVENAKYTLDLVDRGDEITVYEGAETPLQKDHEYADYVHGPGGLGGDLFPETGISSGKRHAVDYIVEMAREHSGELALACIAPLTNLALACRKEPELPALLDEVWVMGGNVNCLGNVTPAAEYNFWVDPDAANIVFEEFEVTLFDWGLTVRDTEFDAEFLAALEDGPDTRLTEFFTELTKHVRAFNREELGADQTTQPDSALLAALIEPDLILESSRYAVEVDEREGMTRGYSAVDELGVLSKAPQTEVVEAFDSARFRQLILDLLFEEAPEASLS